MSFLDMFYIIQLKYELKWAISKPFFVSSCCVAFVAGIIVVDVLFTQLSSTCNGVYTHVYTYIHIKTHHFTMDCTLALVWWNYNDAGTYTRMLNQMHIVFFCRRKTKHMWLVRWISCVPKIHTTRNSVRIYTSSLQY